MTEQEYKVIDLRLVITDDEYFLGGKYHPIDGEYVLKMIGENMEDVIAGVVLASDGFGRLIPTGDQQLFAPNDEELISKMLKEGS